MASSPARIIAPRPSAASAAAASKLLTSAAPAAKPVRTMLGVELKRRIVGTVNALGRGLKIEVFFRGTRAYTNGRMVVLPAIKDLAEIPYDTARALIGYAIHEVGHIRYTDFAEVARAYDGGKLVKKFQNCIEDYRIEREMSRAFAGAAADLSALRVRIHPKLKTLTTGWLADPRACGPLALTWTGADLNGFANPHLQKTLDAIQPPVLALIRNWTDRMEGVETTAETTDLAIAYAEEAIRYAERTQAPDRNAASKSDQSDGSDRAGDEGADPEPKPMAPDQGSADAVGDQDQSPSPSEETDGDDEDAPAEDGGQSGGDQEGPASSGAEGDGDGDEEGSTSDEEVADHESTADDGSADEDGDGIGAGGVDEDEPEETGDEAKAGPDEAGDGDTGADSDGRNADDVGGDEEEVDREGSAEPTPDQDGNPADDADAGSDGASPADADDDLDEGLGQTSLDDHDADRDAGSGDATEGADGPEGAGEPGDDRDRSETEPREENRADRGTDDDGRPEPHPGVGDADDSEGVDDREGAETGEDAGDRSGDPTPRPSGGEEESPDQSGVPDQDDEDDDGPREGSADEVRDVHDEQEDQTKPDAAKGQRDEDGDEDPFASVLDPNAAFDDFLDDIAEAIREAGPLPQQEPEASDGEVDPTQVVDDVAEANDAAPSYDSDNAGDEDEDDDQLQAPQRPMRNDYDDSRFVPIELDKVVDDQFGALRDAASGAISNTARIIKRLLMAEERKGVLSNRRSGDFDIRNMSSIIRGTGTCYKRTWERPAPRTLLATLVDFSGSMKGMHGFPFMAGMPKPQGVMPLTLAMMGALAIEEATRGTSIDTLLYGYTGYSPTVKLYPFKDKSQAQAQTRRMIGAYKHCEMGCTPTGEAMAALAMRMDKADQDRRIMVVLTDGGADDMKLCAEVSNLLIRRGIEVVAIGIQSDTVQEWAPVSHVIQDIGDLPQALLSTIDPRKAKRNRRMAA